MNSPLLTTLNIISLLCDHSYSSAELQRRNENMSIATLKRHIAEARSLGAKIESIKSGSTWCYHLKNKDAVLTRLNRWIELENSKDLTISEV